MHLEVLACLRHFAGDSSILGRVDFHDIYAQIDGKASEDDAKEKGIPVAVYP